MVHRPCLWLARGRRRSCLGEPSLRVLLEKTEQEETLTQIIKAIFGVLSAANYKKAVIVLTVAYGVLSAARDAVGAILAALQ